MMSLVLAATLPAQVSDVRIKRIDIKAVGPPAVAESLVRANIRLKEGESYKRSSADDDIKNLYATGFFWNVHLLEEMTPDGVILTYAVQGKPRVTEIRFEGNKKYSVSKLKKKVASKVGDPCDDRKLFTDAQAIREMYQKAGLHKTEVEYKYDPDESSGRATVTFKITETPKIRIVDVTFDGADSFKQKKLRKTIKTRRHWMFSWITGSGKLKDEQLDDDKETLAEFYHDAGYIDYELKDVKYDYSSPTRVRLHFVVAEGRRYKVGATDFKGVTLFSTNELAGGLTMKAGDVFTPKGLGTNVEAVADFYGAKGYIDTKVLPRKNPNTETGAMDISYEVVEGEPSRIEKIEIKGNYKTKDKVIRRELSVAPGELFDMVRVKRSKGRLEQMNYFERVEARPEDTEVPNRKNLVVNVEEKNTGNLMLGAGFSTVDSLVGFAELTEGNFDLFRPPRFGGGGQKFRMRVAVGLQRQDYQITFVEPWFLDRKLALGVDLYHRDYRFLSDYYDERRTGARFSLTRALGSENLIGSVSYTIENIQEKNVNLDAPNTYLETQDAMLASRLGGTLAYDTRNSVTLADRGQRTEIFGELSGGPMGGDIPMYKLEAKSGWYFKGLAKGHVLELLGKIGVVDSINEGVPLQNAGQVRQLNTTTSVSGQHLTTNFVRGLPVTQWVGGTNTTTSTPVMNAEQNRVPFFERYYLGGAYSLRGFRYRNVSPKETGINGVGMEPIGGNSYYMLSAEYSIPIIDRVRVAAFYDMGNVFYDSYDYQFGTFSASAGLGLRLNLPIGPLRLDLGMPIRKANDEKSQIFNFTVGYNREF